MKIVTIIGARPQFIKAATISRAIKKYNSEYFENQIEEVIVHTGQHFDKNMSEIFFTQMEIPLPNYSLDIHSLGHGSMTGRMLEEVEKVLLVEKPDFVMVYGDTNSTLAGALAAKKIGIKVIHIEAGLRSFNMGMPEEINRILTDRISDILFCPTQSAIDNLNREGFSEFNCQIIKNGDVMQDAAIFYAARAKKPNIQLPDSYILATIHRQENTDDEEKLKTIFSTFNNISKERTIVIPLHPRTRNLIKKYNIDIANILVIEPVGYLEMVYMLKNCMFVMTDSGGLQKEAFFFKKYCLTLRDQTEWVELIENNVNSLISINSIEIKSAVNSVPDNVNFDINLYGNGMASSNIIEALQYENTNN